MTQKSNSRVVIDTNRHGIRREVNLDAEYRASIKKKAYLDKKKRRSKEF
jgi:hypothetical protein